MKMSLERELDYCLAQFEKKQHMLFYGDIEHSLALMKGIYNYADSKNDFLPSWHDSSKINHQLDFFEPILKKNI